MSPWTDNICRASVTNVCCVGTEYLAVTGHSLSDLVSLFICLPVDGQSCVGMSACGKHCGGSKDCEAR